MGKRERRINQTQFEIRTLEDGKTIILEGYALKFGKRSEDFGGVDISIHAPRVRCDKRWRKSEGCLYTFQSTHLV